MNSPDFSAGLDSAMPSDLLPQLRLKRLGSPAEAGLWITSLPLPRSAELTLDLEGKPTHRQAIGRWPGEQEAPRRLLLVADGQNQAPDQLGLHMAQNAVTAPMNTLSGEMELLESSPFPEFFWERHILRLRWNEKSVGLALGMRTRGEVHWWEACRLVVLEQTAQCLTLEMGGAIPHTIIDLQEIRRYKGLMNPWLHRHNWLSGRLYVRLHANGVCEVFAHHINSKFFDEGLDLPDCVPVIGLWTGAEQEQTRRLSGSWDGTTTQLTCGSVRLDLTEAARLATPAQPGRMDAAGSALIWQPYQGVELFGGTCPEQRTGDPCLFRAEAGLFPRGMARTVQFSLSLSDRSPRIARYVAPAWWYGLCEEFVPAPLLPVSDELDTATAAARRWAGEHMVAGGFEDGAIPRHTQFQWQHQGTTRHEPGWEGEIPYALFLAAWRFGDADDYQNAMRAALYFTDVVVDHASLTARMHGYGPPACSLPMNRLQGTIAAHLETGVPYFLEVAQAVTQNSFWHHKNSWPRLAIGRDACFLRSAVLLYRYYARDFFREIAEQVATHTIQSQRPNGSFGDQGGGTGLHQWAGYITKPWMGLLALNGVLDYLELFPDETFLLESVRKFADWLLTERFDHEGTMGWSYQHEYNGGRQFYDPTSGQEATLPGTALWHQDTLARLLTYCTLRFGDPRYHDAWLTSFEKAKHFPLHDHQVAAQLQFLPWVQDATRNLTWRDGRVEARVNLREGAIHKMEAAENRENAAALASPHRLSGTMANQGAGESAARVTTPLGQVSLPSQPDFP